MSQAIAGVAPAEVSERIVMTVWPSVSATLVGRLLGRFYDIKAGFYIFTVGNFAALAFAPLAVPLYLGKVAPGVGIRYTITNRRIIVQKGVMAVNERSIDLDRFDRIEIEVRPGQEWYKSGDLIFLRGDTETFRLEGVGRPESFVAACMKSRSAYVGVKAAQEAGHA